MGRGTFLKTRDHSNRRPTGRQHVRRRAITITPLGSRRCPIVSRHDHARMSARVANTASTLPGGREREEVQDSGRVYDLRGSEVDLLESAGRCRVTFTDDLKRDASHSRFDEDLRSLKEQGLIEERR